MMAPPPATAGGRGISFDGRRRGRPGDRVRRYFGRKLFIYLLTFFVAATIDWMIPRFMPGDPIQSAAVAHPGRARGGRQDLIALLQRTCSGSTRRSGSSTSTSGAASSRATSGAASTSPAVPVTELIMAALPVHAGAARPGDPAQLVGRQQGRRARRPPEGARQHRPAGRLHPDRDARTCGWRSCSPGSSPRSWGSSRSPAATSYSLEPSLTWEFVGTSPRHWFLPFLSLFLVMFGGWAIGMRNMIIYELEADYSRYLGALGAPRELVRRYAYRNAVLPQITGLALALGVDRRRRPRDRDRLLVPGHREAAPGGGPEPGLLPPPGDLPLHHHRRPRRQLHRRHRLRPRRPADARRDAGGA